jgi:tetratricopeptide (TPR) repeat protein
MPLTSLARVCSIVLMMLPLAAGKAADSAAGKNAAKVLLEKGWKKPPGKDALVDHPRLEEPPLAGDSSVLAARWLVLMYQGRWDDALAGLEKLLKAEPAEDLKIQALRAKAWILTVKKDYPKAMVVADQLSQAAVPNPQVTDKATLEAQDEAIAFLGRLAGFVEGPSETGAGDQTVRTKLEARVLERLDDARKDKFKAAKTEVLEEFARLTKKAAQAKEDTKANADATKAQKLGELDEAQAKLSKATGEVQDKAKKLADEVERRLAELRRMDAIVLQEMSTLQSRYRQISQEIARKEDIVHDWEFRNDKGDKDRPAPSPPAHVRQAKAEASALRRNLDEVNNQLQLRQGRRVVLQQEALKVNGGAMQVGQQLAGEQSKIDKAKQRNENIKARTERVKVGVGGKALSIENEAGAFRTYEPFPLEELREELLAKMK